MCMCVVCVCMCERSPAGCCPRVCRLCPSCAASIWVSDRQQRRAHTWQKGRLELSTEEHMLRAFSPPTHTHTNNTHTPHHGCQSCKATKKQWVPIYHSVLYFTQARQQQHHHTTTLKPLLRNTYYEYAATNRKKKTPQRFTDKLLCFISTVYVSIFLPFPAICV